MGDPNATALLTPRSLGYDRQECFFHVPGSANNHSSRKQGWSSSLWLLEEETGTNENPQDTWGWQKETPFPQALQVSSKKANDLKSSYTLHRNWKLVLHGNQESELDSRGNSEVICQSLNLINFRNNDELISSLWQVDKLSLLLNKLKVKGCSTVFQLPLWGHRWESMLLSQG